ncbi:hypothetical protein LEMLEM_LOCUS25776 [Lemmus lemmus]
MLRGGDDAHGCPTVRHGPLWCGVPCQPASGRCDDCGRHTYQQDGSCTPQGTPALLGSFSFPATHRHCQWWGLLPLLLLGGSRLRPYCARGHLCARLPAHSRGTALWNPAAAAEDQARAEAEDLVPQVEPPGRAPQLRNPSVNKPTLVPCVLCVDCGPVGRHRTGHVLCPP